MHFSAKYTDWAIKPHDTSIGQPPKFSLYLTLKVALEFDWADVGQQKIATLFQQGLNHYAGGRRMLSGNHVNLIWTLNWRQPHQVAFGDALGISLIPDDMLSDKAGKHVTIEVISSSGTTLTSRVLLRSNEFKRAAMSRRANYSVRKVRATSAHEVGHALGLDHVDAKSSIMHRKRLNRRQARRIRQRLTDTELREAIRNVMPANVRPVWLQ